MISCCCIDADDSCTLEHQVLRRARKRYTCGECDEPIEPGQRYERAKTLFDGSWSTHITCLPCVGIRRDFFPCGYYYGGMRQDFKDCLGWDYATEISYE